MTKRDWWLGVSIVTAAILFHAVFPRYEIHQNETFSMSSRVDRWTGTMQVLARNPKWLAPADPK